MKSNNFLRGFTLVEMLIVVAILAVLMTIMFRLGSLGNRDNARTITIVRLQKIENCLSGYYAAFGSYPPVQNHGYHEIDRAVDANGDQSDTGGGGSANQKASGEDLVWAQVEAACRCQPFGCEYPPSRDASGNDRSETEIIEDWAREVSARVGNSGEYPKYSQQNWAYANIFSGGTISGPDVQQGGFVSEWDNSDWKAIKLFKFGVMSFLLPRYLFMMGGDARCFGSSGDPCAQWGDNNDMPADPFTGKAYDVQYQGWEDVRKFSQTGVEEKNIDRQDLAKVANIPSQAVCARWMPNLEDLCNTIKPMKIFGIDITYSSGLSVGSEGSDGEIYPPQSLRTHSPPNGAGGHYMNAVVTINDGWGTEFFYYSPPPYQSYTLWSAGPNTKTFPPWMAIEDLNTSQRDTAMKWKNDDIMQMSH